MEAIDTHIHLDRIPDFKNQIDVAAKAGIRRWVIPGVSPKGWSSLLAIAEEHRGVYAAPGIHPQAAGDCSAESLNRLRCLLSLPEVVAIGEVGLDRMVDIDLSVQEQVFVEMIRLAKESGKPLLIHSRKATEKVLEVLKKEAADKVGGIFHAFSGSLETARKIVDLGFVIGVGGGVTWPTARKLPAIVRSLPEETLVLETDAPFMAPAPYQKQENRPVLLTEVIKMIAELRGWSTQTTIQVTTENAKRVLNLTE